MPPPDAPRPWSQPDLLRRFTATLVVWTAVTTSAVALLPADPTDIRFDLIVVAPVSVLPALFLLAYRHASRFRATVLSLDLTAVTAVQGMRIAGIAMLTLGAAGIMNPAFALWAGGLDVLVGLTAVPLAHIALRRRPLPRRGLCAWHALGLLDFLGAVPLGLAATPTAGRLLGGPSTIHMFSLPLSFIPMVGVPFTAIMHLTAILILRTRTDPLTTPLVATTTAAR